MVVPAASGPHLQGLVVNVLLVLPLLVSKAVHVLLQLHLLLLRLQLQIVVLCAGGGGEREGRASGEQYRFHGYFPLIYC
jgi:hypothetical protein